MNNDICFMLGNKILIMDQVLIDYNEEPVFYICKTDNEKYFVLCTDIQKMEYYVIKTDIVSILSMLDREETMRDALLRGNEFWHVVAGDSFEHDIINKLTMSDLEIEDLPKAGAYYTICSKEVSIYRKRLSDSIFSKDKWDSLLQLVQYISSPEYEKERLAVMKAYASFVSTINAMMMTSDSNTKDRHEYDDTRIEASTVEEIRIYDASDYLMVA